MAKLYAEIAKMVSTHSRLKAAGFQVKKRSQQVGSFNTQPPEGGWRIISLPFFQRRRFNTQPPEGGWYRLTSLFAIILSFQHTAA